MTVPLRRSKLVHARLMFGFQAWSWATVMSMICSRIMSRHVSSGRTICTAHGSGKQIFVPACGRLEQYTSMLFIQVTEKVDTFCERAIDLQVSPCLMVYGNSQLR